MLRCIFACTQSKTLTPNAALCASSYQDVEPEEAAVKWQTALDSDPDKTTLAKLYKGGYWSSVISITTQTNLPFAGYVMSAGAGLRAFNEQAPAYAATFTSGKIDTVPGGKSLDGCIAWWTALGGRDRLRDLAKDHKGVIAVALPGIYLEVAIKDLLYLQEQIGPEALTVFTANKSAIQLLGASAVPLDYRMSAVLGSTASEVTVRSLRHVMKTATSVEHLSAKRANETLEPVREAAPDIFYPIRTKQTEEEVAKWIVESKLRDQPPTSASAALRLFRDEGFAFEQRRFGHLFKAIQEGNYP